MGRPLGDLAGTLLLKVSRLQEIRFDPAARQVRVGAGVKWDRVAPRLSAHGLAGLHGSSPDVGIAGYSLGGGMGWLARRHGLQTNAVTAIEFAVHPVDELYAGALFFPFEGASEVLHGDRRDPRGRRPGLGSRRDADDASVPPDGRRARSRGPGAGARATLPGEVNMYTLGVVLDETSHAEVRAAVADVEAAVRPHRAHDQGAL